MQRSSGRITWYGALQSEAMLPACFREHPTPISGGFEIFYESYHFQDIGH